MKISEKFKQVVGIRKEIHSLVRQMRNANQTEKEQCKGKLSELWEQERKLKTELEMLLDNE